MNISGDEILNVSDFLEDIENSCEWELIKFENYDYPKQLVTNPGLELVGEGLNLPNLLNETEKYVRN